MNIGDPSIPRNWIEGNFLFFLFDDSNLHYTHAHTVWGGQRGFEPLSNGGEFSLAPLGMGRREFLRCYTKAVSW